jgi:putative oxidoreductase
MRRLAKLAPYLQSVLRIVVAFAYFTHGTQKAFAYPAAAGAHAFPLTSLLGAAGAIELVGGALLLVGLFTRPVAFMCAGEMAYAYFYQHAPRGVWYFPIMNGGELAVLYCFIWLYFCAAGPGPISVDRLRRQA